MAIGPEICGGAWLRVCQVRIEGQQQRRAFLDEAYPGVPVAVYAAFVPFGLAEPAFQVKVVLGQVGLLTPNKQPGGKARHHLAHVVPDRVGTALELRLQRLKLRLSLRARATVRIEGGLDGLHLSHLVAHVLLGGLHAAQPPVDVAGQTGESVLSSPPFCASTFRWSEACTSVKASAMRNPGGCRGPP